MATTTIFLRPLFYRQMNPSAATRWSVRLYLARDSDYFLFHVKVNSCTLYCKYNHSMIYPCCYFICAKVVTPTWWGAERKATLRKAGWGPGEAWKMTDSGQSASTTLRPLMSTRRLKFCRKSAPIKGTETGAELWPEGQERASATAFLEPGTWTILLENSEM